ncbi:IS6 family transposase, partial [Streptomyces atratus]
GLRRRRPRPGDKWHLDEVFIRINGELKYLWRTVDQDGNVLDILVQGHRDKAAARRFFRKLMKKTRAVPRVVVTDKLRSYGAAHREVMPLVEHRSHKGLNNRAENSHQPTRQRERAMKGFHSIGGAQRFLSAFKTQQAVNNDQAAPAVLSCRAARSAHAAQRSAGGPAVPAQVPRRRGGATAASLAPPHSAAPRSSRFGSCPAISAAPEQPVLIAHATPVHRRERQPHDGRLLCFVHGWRGIPRAFICATTLACSSRSGSSSAGNVKGATVAPLRRVRLAVRSPSCVFQSLTVSVLRLVCTGRRRLPAR